MTSYKYYFAILGILFLNACQQSDTKKIDVNAILDKATAQTKLLLNEAEKADRIPRTVTPEGEMHWTNLGFDWTEGFFPGTCWYLYKNTNDTLWKQAAEKFQNKFESHKYSTHNHDLGFIFNCSYGNGYRITKDNHFKEVMKTAADSLITRFNPAVGCIQSWDVTNGWQAERGWQFPVIIDNMMNLELLFEVSKFTRDDTYKNIAIAHADTTMKNHFRDNYSSVHVVDYDSVSGMVRSKQTAQGYADDSSWARGQAWALYGYTVCYRYTKDSKYLDFADKIANYVTTYKDTPEDGIPYWDYNAPDIPNAPRDASAAAITASALLELDNFSKKDYQTDYEKILKSLASDAYTANIGTNHNFILMHSVGSIPHKNEIDVPLNYADYYYVEALMRYKALNKSL